VVVVVTAAPPVVATATPPVWLSVVLIRERLAMWTRTFLVEPAGRSPDTALHQRVSCCRLCIGIMWWLRRRDQVHARPCRARAVLAVTRGFVSFGGARNGGEVPLVLIDSTDLFRSVRGGHNKGGLIAASEVRRVAPICTWPLDAGYVIRRVTLPP